MYLILGNRLYSHPCKEKWIHNYVDQEDLYHNYKFHVHMSMDFDSGGGRGKMDTYIVLMNIMFKSNLLFSHTSVRKTEFIIHKPITYIVNFLPPSPPPPKVGVPTLGWSQNGHIVVLYMMVKKIFLPTGIENVCIFRKKTSSCHI